MPVTQTRCRWSKPRLQRLFDTRGLLPAGGYPVEFLDTLAVGEQSGKVVESMGRLARQYQERARMAMAAMAVAAGWAVWALVATLIVALIFRIASIYLNAIRGDIGR